MSCGRNTMRWKNAMQIARRQYPSMGLARRKKVAGGIVSKGNKK